MAGKVLVVVAAPVSQTIEAVQALLAWRKMPTNPLPNHIELPGHAVILVLGSKKDIYYTVTADNCSCPARTYHPGQRCKHQKRYFPQGEEKKQWSDGTPIQQVTPKPGAWNGHNGPVEEEASKTLLEEMADQGYEMSFTPEDEDDTPKASPLENLIDTWAYETLPGEIAYWEHKAQAQQEAA